MCVERLHNLRKGVKEVNQHSANTPALGSRKHYKIAAETLYIVGRSKGRCGLSDDLQVTVNRRLSLLWNCQKATSPLQCPRLSLHVTGYFRKRAPRRCVISLVCRRQAEGGKECLNFATAVCDVCAAVRCNRCILIRTTQEFIISAAIQGVFQKAAAKTQLRPVKVNHLPQNRWRGGVAQTANRSNQIEPAKSCSLY